MAKRHAYAYTLDGARRLDLGRYKEDDTAGLEKEEALARIEKLGDEVAELTNLLAFAQDHALLLVFQGRDASGKDGVVRQTLRFANVLNATVTAFKVPTEEEKAHDFLWRVHKVAPRKGHLALFNRSHYEDVIATRVHKLVAPEVWKARYDEINQFERLLSKDGTIVLKFYLHVSRTEQHGRLLDREKDPRTAWKLGVSDWRELPLWDETTDAYEEALARCSSPELPFYLVPADKKWFRNLAVLERIAMALRPYRDGWLRTLKKARRSALSEIRLMRGKIPPP